MASSIPFPDPFRTLPEAKNTPFFIVFRALACLFTFFFGAIPYLVCGFFRVRSGRVSGDSGCHKRTLEDLVLY